MEVIANKERLVSPYSGSAPLSTICLASAGENGTSGTKKQSSATTLTFGAVKVQSVPEPETTNEGVENEGEDEEQSRAQNRRLRSNSAMVRGSEGVAVVAAIDIEVETELERVARPRSESCANSSSSSLPSAFGSVPHSRVSSAGPVDGTSIARPLPALSSSISTSSSYFASLAASPAACPCDAVFYSRLARRHAFLQQMMVMHLPQLASAPPNVHSTKVSEKKAGARATTTASVVGPSIVRVTCPLYTRSFRLDAKTTTLDVGTIS